MRLEWDQNVICFMNFHEPKMDKSSISRCASILSTSQLEKAFLDWSTDSKPLENMWVICLSSSQSEVLPTRPERPERVHNLLQSRDHWPHPCPSSAQGIQRLVAIVASLTSGAELGCPSLSFGKTLTMVPTCIQKLSRTATTTNRHRPRTVP